MTYFCSTPIFILKNVMENNFSILIADDHSVVRQGVSLMLKESFDNLKITQADTFSKVLEALENQSFDMIVLDISIPEGKGVKMCELIKAIQSNIKILIFSANKEELYALRYLKAGADGYLNKLSSEQEFKQAFTSMIETGSYISEFVKKKIIENTLNNQSDNPLELLSSRELEIARLMVRGDGNLEISNKLDLQNSTISTYKNRIYEKLSIKSTVALVDLFRAYDDSEEYNEH